MMPPEELWLFSIIITVVGLLLFNGILFLYRRFRSFHYRPTFQPKDYYFVNVAGGDDNNDGKSIVSSLATINRAIELGKLSDIEFEIVIFGDYTDDRDRN